jgi:diguanylate cyclase (GGDEF)-like protein
MPGKIVLLNHRSEIGGYDLALADARAASEKDFNEILFKEMSIRGISDISDLTNKYKSNIDKIKKNFERGDMWHRGLLDEALGINPCTTFLGVPIILDGKPVGCVKIEGANRKPQKIEDYSELSKQNRPSTEESHINLSRDSNNQKSEGGTSKDLYEFERFTFQHMVMLDCIAGIVSNILHTAKVMYDWRVSTRLKAIYTREAITDIYITPQVLSVIFIDVDDFKKINEQKGYNEANIVLKDVAEVIYDSCKDFEKDHDEKPLSVARYGGDEFIVVLAKYLTRQEIDEMFHIIRIKMNHMGFGTNKDIPVSVSIGCATSNNENDKISIKKVIEDAGVASRVAKFSGKNRLVCYNDIKKLIENEPPGMIIENLSEKISIINIGNEDGLFQGMVFEVKHTPRINARRHAATVDQLEEKFDFTKAHARVEKIYPKVSTVWIESRTSDIIEGDPVILKR